MASLHAEAHLGEDPALVRCALLLAALALLAGCGGGSGGFVSPATPTPVATTPPPTPSPTPSTGPTPTPPPPLYPTGGNIYLGAYVNPKGTAQPNNTQLAALEQTIGRRFAISMHYYPFSGSGAAAFPGAPEADDIANGRVPVESWDCEYPDVQIVAGQYDSVIAAEAQSIRAFGYPIFLRYMWDANLAYPVLDRQSCWDAVTDGPNGTFSPGEYIAAWNHIRGIFAAAGVTNVVWLWTAYSNGVSPLPYYPGQSSTDWVGMDAYNLSAGSFNETYQQPYGVMAALGKPIMISETGTSTATQAAFFKAAAPALETAFPQVAAWVYFDAVDTQKNDWTLGNAGTTAFTAMAGNSYLTAYPDLSPQAAGRLRRRPGRSR